MAIGDDTEQRAIQLLVQQGNDAGVVRAVLAALRDAGIRLADERNNELAVRWVDVLERAVPPDADTIIRTITRTIDGHSTSTTHWLDGLRAPRSGV
jgi:hypothetical protein